MTKPNLNRRSFLTRFFGGAVGLAAAVAIDPEILLWKPEAKTIFIPKAIVAPPPIVITQAMHDSIVAAQSGLFKNLDLDIVMDLNDAALMMEGSPLGWERSGRQAYYSAFVRKINV